MNTDTLTIDLTAQKQANLSEDFNSYLSLKQEIARLGYNPNTRAIVRFYEWSCLENEKTYTDMDEFFKFLRSSGIIFYQYQEKRIQTLAHTTGCWVMCKPGTKELIIENCYWSLKQEFERVINPSHTPAYSIPVCGGRYPYDEEYDCWE